MSIATLMRHEATDAVKEITGLDGGPIVADDVAAPKADVLAIDLIDPTKPEGKTLHDKVLGYAVGRLEASEKVMTVFHPCWNKAEKVMQAYIKRDIDEETNKVLQLNQIVLGLNYYLELPNGSFQSVIPNITFVS